MPRKKTVSQETKQKLRASTKLYWRKRKAAKRQLELGVPQGEPLDLSWLKVEKRPDGTVIVSLRGDAT